jgi:hypothetical protein
MDRDFEMDQIRRAIDVVMNHFGKYVVDCDASWPRCYIHQTEMCQVIKRGENTYYQCFEFDDEGKFCGHKEWSI